jgi:hypothetical protein
MASMKSKELYYVGVRPFFVLEHQNLLQKSSAGKSRFTYSPITISHALMMFSK